MSKSEEKTKELIEKGEAYLESKDYKEAKKSFEKAIKLDEKNIGAWIGLGRFYVKLNENYEEAKKCFEEIWRNMTMPLNPTKKQSNWIKKMLMHG
jgi:Tfp pilus assembly protein PilF